MWHLLKHPSPSSCRPPLGELGERCDSPPLTCLLPGTVGLLEQSMKWALGRFPKAEGLFYKFQGETFLRTDFELDKIDGIRVVDVLGSSMEKRKEGNPC